MGIDGTHLPTVSICVSSQIKLVASALGVTIMGSAKPASRAINQHMEIAHMTTASNIFATLTASTTKAEMLSMLRNPDFAIGWALEHLEPFELASFFTDYKADADLSPWLDAWAEDQKAGQSV